MYGNPSSTLRINKNSFHTDNVMLGEVLGNGKKYSVPIYQRNYAWNIDHWEELWADILEIYHGNTQGHFIGSIVLLSDNQEDNIFEIIDGQQRLTTISILVIAVLSRMKNLINGNADFKIIYDDRNSQFISKFAVGGIRQPKLTLNKVNNDYYKFTMVQINIHDKPTKKNDKNLYDCFHYFEKKIDKCLSEINDDFMQLNDFLENIIAKKLWLIQIITAQKELAFTLFETLNARGEHLTEVDLIKNLILSDIGFDSSQDLIDLWRNLENIIDSASLPIFIRYYYNSSIHFVRNNKLYSEIKKKIHNGEIHPSEFMLDLIKYAEIYQALGDSNHAYWRDNKKLQILIRDYNYLNHGQSKVLLMQAYNSFDTKNFINILYNLINLIFRYAVIARRATNIMETLFSRIAIKIKNKEFKTFQDCINDLVVLGISDEEFESQFKNYAIEIKDKNKNLVRYILHKIENHYKPNTDTNLATIEHILPEKHHANWVDKFDEKQHEEYNSFLGNYTLWEKSLNDAHPNKDIFADKCPDYFKSEYEMTKKLHQYPDWNIDFLLHRQTEFTEIAKNIWAKNLDYLDLEAFE